MIPIPTLTCGDGCALGRTRTCNLLIRSQVLYPLSYERTGRVAAPTGTGYPHLSGRSDRGPARNRRQAPPSFRVTVTGLKDAPVTSTFCDASLSTAFCT